MDYVFNKLTDIGLRRLYKFVLKRTIGKYLEDELLIDQLEVKSRDGIVRLSDIRFSAAVLNEELFDALPVKIVSLTVSELEVHLSYKTLLTDSCRFVVDKVDIVIAPNELFVKSKANSQSKATDERTGEVPAPPVAEQTSMEGQKGLSFIAHWIEVVVARLQVQVNSVNVTFQIPAKPAVQPEGKATRRAGDSSATLKQPAETVYSIQLCLTNIHYFNDDPKAYSATDASSVALSTKLTSGTDASVAMQLGSRKVCRFVLLALIWHVSHVLIFTFATRLSSWRASRWC
jgi:hypothetical protein